jgi:hypothetical protein
MNQRLCNLKELPELYCTMQDLLYKYHDPHNVTYLRKYLFVISGRIPDLVKEQIESKHIDIEDLSLAGLQEQIMTTLQKECMRHKTSKSVKERLGFDHSVCDIYAKTYHFGCGKNKHMKSSCGEHCKCNKCKSMSRSFKPWYRLKKSRKFYKTKLSTHLY